VRIGCAPEEERHDEPKRAFRGPLAAARERRHLTGVAPKPKRAVNLSVNAELLKVAKEMNINLSHALERTWQAHGRRAGAPIL
jgi:post-segregation antitoxin (ccd killing protein)